ncbi:MAG: MATE family efflux transporter [Oscillospiraceae bacterium]|jgi:putative MATE family efflux protein|nr:MATE family efflux transporter [Oscillospiraceae bacterium]
MTYDLRGITRLLWPVLLEQSFAVFISMLSTMMVSGVGPAAVAGVGLVGTINAILTTTFIAVASGTTIIVSQRLGADRREEAGQSAAQSITLAAYIGLGIGGLMMILADPLLSSLFPGAEPAVLSNAKLYLTFSSLSLPLQALFSTMAGIMRAAGNVRLPMLGSVMTDTAYILIAWPAISLMNLGVAGAGWGLVASRLVPVIFLSLSLMRGHGGLYLPRISPKLSGKILRPVLQVAIPTGLDSLMFNGGKLIVQVFLAGMGTAALAANSICSSLVGFVNLPGGSMQVIAVTVVGRIYGAKRFGDVRKFALGFTLAATAMQTILSLIMWPLLGTGISLYQPTQESLELSRSVMGLLLVTTPLFWAVSFVAPSGLRASGDVKFTMWVSVCSMFILRVFGSWFFGVYLGMGLEGIWLSMSVDWVGRGLFFLPRILSHKKRLLAKHAPPPEALPEAT